MFQDIPLICRIVWSCCVSEVLGFCALACSGFGTQIKLIQHWLSKVRYALRPNMTPEPRNLHPLFLVGRTWLPPSEFSRLPKVDSFNQNLGSKCKCEVMLVTGMGFWKHPKYQTLLGTTPGRGHLFGNLSKKPPIVDRGWWCSFFADHFFFSSWMNLLHQDSGSIHTGPLHQFQ